MDIWSIRHGKKECVMKYEFFLIEHSIDMLFLKNHFFLNITSQNEATSYLKSTEMVLFVAFAV